MISNSSRPHEPARFRSTTVLLVRRGEHLCLASDGQVTMNNTIMKAGARKVRRIGKDHTVLAGFAGGAADGLALFTRLEAKLEEYPANLERAVVELAKDWRTDRAMRRLEALMLVADKDRSFLLNGGGDLMTPDLIESEDGHGRQELMSVGSGSNYALSAARALMRHTSLSAIEIAREAMRIAAEICVFTNDRVTIEEL
jgi:ATP-dependent HslUV protease subunit HslV